MCAPASLKLWLSLNAAGIKAKIAESAYHVFVLENSGYIVDVTATQFGKKPILIRKLRKPVEEIDWQILQLYETPEDFLRLTTQDWFANQNNPRLIDHLQRDTCLRLPR